MKSPHALLRFLEEQRRVTEHRMGRRPIGAAFCEVLDELIRRTRLLTDAVPADAPMTRSLIEGHAGDVADTLALVTRTLRKMADLATEVNGAVEQRRQPYLRFVARVESEGYQVADNHTVTDTVDWSALDANGVAAVEVQHAAERIARAEQAVIYQQRIERMAAGIGETEHRYAQRIRDLICEFG